MIYNARQRRKQQKKSGEAQEEEEEVEGRMRVLELYSGIGGMHYALIGKVVIANVLLHVYMLPLRAPPTTRGYMHDRARLHLSADSP